MANDPKAKTTPAKPKADAPKNPRERFLTVGANRVGKSMTAIRNVANISNRKSYEYTEAEARKAISAIRAEIDAVEKSFNEALAGKGATKEKTSFSFA